MKSIKDFKYFEISNPETIKGGIADTLSKVCLTDITTKGCVVVEVKVCATLELKKCEAVEVKCDIFSVTTDDGKEIGWGK